MVDSKLSNGELLFSFKCNYVFYVVCMREHVYRTDSCDNVILAEDLEVACL